MNSRTCTAPITITITLAMAPALIGGCAKASSSVDSTRARPIDSVRVARPSDSVWAPVLVYHSVAHHHVGQTGEQRELDVDTAVFRQEMDILVRQHRPVISLSDLVDALEARRSLPARAVVITFDDGWQDQYEYAFPILRQRGFTATFFVYTNAIGKWPGFMTWPELRELQGAGMTIGAHSRTHPALTERRVNLSSEIDGSREDIARNLGVTPELFAYPYGASDARVAAAVRAAGFRGARGMGDGPLNTRSEIFDIHSILATDDVQAFERALSAGGKRSERSRSSLPSHDQ